MLLIGDIHAELFACKYARARVSVSGEECTNPRSRIDLLTLLAF